MKESPAYDIQRVLQEMRDEYWHSLEAAETEETGELSEYLVFRLGDERFGVAAGLTRQVLRSPRLVRVPQVPGHIRGVINLRGQIVAVTDLRQALGLAPDTAVDPGRLVVVEAAGVTTALATEGVEGIRAVPPEDIEPLAEGLTHLPREAVAGQVADGDELVILLNLPALLAQEQFTVDQKGE